MKLAARADYMWGLINRSPNLMVPWYLMASHLYYQHDISLLPDEEYDRLCKRLLLEFDSIEHPNKHIVDREGLSAGTGYAIAEYPGKTQSAALRLAIEDKHVRWNKRRLQWERQG